jgi:hypothetical protein
LIYSIEPHGENLKKNEKTGEQGENEGKVERGD